MLRSPTICPKRPGRGNFLGALAPGASMCCTLFLSLGATVAQAQDGCDGWRAEFVAVDGSVEIRSGGGQWRTVRQGSYACRGDEILVNDFSRAALRLPDRSELALDQNTQFTLGEREKTERTVLRIIRGFIHIISRDPRALSFSTPYANAGLEGTEFTIGVSDNDTEITVVEGEVAVTRGDTRLDVDAGRRIAVGATGDPVVVEIDDPFEAADWTPYFAHLSSGRLPAPDAEPQESERSSVDFFVARAESRLRSGATEAAEEDIARAAALDPEAASPNALRAVVALGRHDKPAARVFVNRALAAEPDSIPVLLAVSYVQQAEFDFAGASATLSRAAELAPENPLVLARLGELDLDLGDFGSGLAAAEKAVSLDPTLGQAHAIVGFVALAESRHAAAIEAFSRAAKLDQASPLPRLGLALALLREGRIEEGRDQLESAVILDPSNAATRSYMAKVYAETDSDALARSQLELAASLDPDDPTSYLYRALVAQPQNYPIEALQALNTAAELNGNRPVHRSQLRVDEDRAVRTAGVGRLYRDLGFEDLALLAARKSTMSDRFDAAGHRLLGDVYSTLPRHEMARVDEVFQYQLNQPTSLTPVPPQLGEPNLFILDDAGPAELAFSEFGSLLDRDGIRLQGSAVSAGNETQGYDVELAGLHERLAYGFGHFDYETDGFRPNNDLKQDVSNAFLQFRPSPDFNFLAELRTSTVTQGVIRLLFDPEDFEESLRQHEKVDSLRLGGRRILSNGGTLLGALILEDTNSDAVSTGFALDASRSGGSLELEYGQRLGRWQVTTGLYHLRQNEKELQTLSGTLPFPPFQPYELTTFATTEPEETVAYAYTDVEIGSKVVTTFGVSASRVSGPLGETRQAGPKLGILYQPSARTSVRAGAFRTLQGPFVSRHNVQPRLEPTQIAGFNQFFFGPEGEDAWRYGVGLDHTFSDRLFGGIELSRRDLESESLVELPGATTIGFSEQNETLARTYLYWTPNQRLSMSATYQRERVDVGGTSLVGSFAELDTNRLPIEVNYFSRGAFRVRARLTFVDQAGRFVPSGFGPNPPIMPGRDSFHVLDLSASYRLPNRSGSVSLGIYNALDEQFMFQDTDPENPSIIPERMVALRFTLAH